MTKPEAAQEQQNMAHGGGVGPTTAPKVDLPPVGSSESMKTALMVIDHCVEWLERIPPGELREWAIRSIVATIKTREAKAPADK